MFIPYQALLGFMEVTFHKTHVKHSSDIKEFTF